MTKQKHEAEVKRRYLLGLRCEQWLALNDQTAIGKRFGITHKQVSALLNENKKPRVLDDDQAREVLRLARHSRRVKAIRMHNSERQLIREYGLWVRRVCSGGPKRPEKKKDQPSPVMAFLTRPATSCQGATGYY